MLKLKHIECDCEAPTLQIALQCRIYEHICKVGTRLLATLYTDETDTKKHDNYVRLKNIFKHFAAERSFCMFSLYSQ